MTGELKAYLIRKNGYYYRPDCQGYTSDPAQAGRYTLEEADLETHPNGPDGPRDGMSYMLASEVIPPDPEADTIATLQATVERQAAEIARKDAALRMIAGCSSYAPGDVVDIARKALEDNNG